MDTPRRRLCSSSNVSIKYSSSITRPISPEHVLYKQSHSARYCLEIKFKSSFSVQAFLLFWLFLLAIPANFFRPLTILRALLVAGRKPYGFFSALYHIVKIDRAPHARVVSAFFRRNGKYIFSLWNVSSVVRQSQKSSSNLSISQGIFKPCCRADSQRCRYRMYHFFLLNDSFFLTTRRKCV